VKFDRRVFVTGRSMVNNVQMAREVGYLKVPDGVLMNVKEMRGYPDAKTIVICTGSQGEPTAALTRIANGDHQHVTIHEDDTVILSSNPVPGNEKLVYRNIDRLFAAGATVLYNRIADVHVRGHAAIEELKVIHRLVRPRHFLGIHGEYRHLVKHRELAMKLGMAGDDAFVMTDGDVLEIDEDGATVSEERVPADYVYVDGLGIGDVDQILLRDRSHLANDGMLVVVAAVDRKTGILVRTPEVMSHGFVGPDAEASLLEGVEQLVTDKLGGEGDHVDWTSIHAALKDEIASYLHKQTHRRPLVLPVMMEV
jgi:ribonuclease J